jgi:hypothetical protein
MPSQRNTEDEQGRGVEHALHATHVHWTASQELARWIWFELGSSIVALLGLGSFLANHVRELRFAFPTCVLMAAAVLTLAASARQLVVLSRARGGSPVAKLRRQELTALRAMVMRWVLRLSPLLWIPLAIVVAQAWCGYDLYDAFGRSWLVVNLIAGLVLMDLVALLGNRMGYGSREQLAF